MDDEDVINMLSEMAVSSKGKDQRSIVADMETMGFYPEIIRSAEDYYKNVLGAVTKRKMMRKQMIFDAVYRAHLQLKKVISPVDLAARVGIPKGRIGKSRSDNFTIRMIRTCEVNITTVEQFIDYYTKKFEIGEYTDLIKKYKRSLSLSPELNNKSPSMIALSLIYLFVEQNPIKDFDRKVIFKSGVTLNTIKKFRDMISHPEEYGDADLSELDKYI